MAYSSPMCSTVLEVGSSPAGVLLVSLECICLKSQLCGWTFGLRVCRRSPPIIPVSPTLPNPGSGLGPEIKVLESLCAHVRYAHGAFSWKARPPSVSLSPPHLTWPGLACHFFFGPGSGLGLPAESLSANCAHAGCSLRTVDRPELERELGDSQDSVPSG
jgi:hypothetical protein